MSTIQVLHLLTIGLLLAVGFAITAEVWMRRTKRYCADCGQRLLERHARVGFNPRTGQVRVLTFRACPDAPAAELPGEWDGDVVRCHRAPPYA